jgi:hypothetical protein
VWEPDGFGAASSGAPNVSAPGRLPDVVVRGAPQDIEAALDLIARTLHVRPEVLGDDRWRLIFTQSERTHLIYLSRRAALHLAWRMWAEEMRQEYLHFYEKWGGYDAPQWI